MMKKISKLLQDIFHIHKWSSCSEELIDNMGCFEYEATCVKCDAKEILGGTETRSEEKGGEKTPSGTNSHNGRIAGNRRSYQMHEV